MTRRSLSLGVCCLFVVVGASAVPARADLVLKPSSSRHGAVVFDLHAFRSYRFTRAVLLPGRAHLRKRRLAKAVSRGSLVVRRRLFRHRRSAHHGRHRARYRLRLKVARGSRLRWAPPPLGNPLTVFAAAAPRSGDNAHQLNLSPGRDYVVRLPREPLHGGLTIQGGRNVVLVGGEIEVPRQPGDRPSGESRRGLYLTDQTGTVHVEGVLLTGPDLSEGINLSEPDGAVVQIENVRVEAVHARDEGLFSDNHPDVLQTWAGPAALRVDRLTGSTDYQGFFLAPNQFGSQPPPWQVMLSRIDLRPITPAEHCSCILLWQDSSFPIVARDVWLIPHPPVSFLGSLWPSPAPWTGVTEGVPPRGEFVPSGLAGLQYQSPGYRAR